MARARTFGQLEKRYANLLFEYEGAEKVVEPVVGKDNIFLAWEQIEARKRELRRQMADIASALKQFDPDWDEAHIRPKAARVSRRPEGGWAKTAYRILRASPAPMTTRQLARAVSAEVGMTDVTNAELIGIVNTIQSALKRQVGLTLKLEGVEPMKWSILPRDQVRRKPLPED